MMNKAFFMCSGHIFDSSILLQTFNRSFDFKAMSIGFCNQMPYIF